MDNVLEHQLIGILLLNLPLTLRYYNQNVTKNKRKIKENNTSKSNYRPVSHLKSSSKPLEILANLQVLRYPESNNILPHSQHGFRRKKSTFSVYFLSIVLWMNPPQKRI